jgi:hypothetical protein
MRRFSHHSQAYSMTVCLFLLCGLVLAQAQTSKPVKLALEAQTKTVACWRQNVNRDRLCRIPATSP